MKNPVNDDRPVFVQEWRYENFSDRSIRPSIIQDRSWKLRTIPIPIEYWEFKFLRGGSFDGADRRESWDGTDWMSIKRPHFIIPGGDGYRGPFFEAELSGFRVVRNK